MLKEIRDNFKKDFDSYSRNEMDCMLKELQKIYEGKFKVSYPTDIFPHIHFRKSKQEIFAIAMLDSSNKVIGIKKITKGLLNRTLIHPREVFIPAIKSHSNSIILIHNHPSHVVTPSKEDIEVTKRLKAASEIIGISILDHIIVSAFDYYSFSENNQM